MLHLPGHARSLEAAHQGDESCVVVGIQRVEDCLGQSPLLLQGAEEGGQIGQVYSWPDAVISGIRSQKPVHLGVVIALSGKVKLHHPVSFVIASSEEKKQGCLVLPLLFPGHLFPGQPPFQDGVQLFRASGPIADIVQSVVGHPAAVGMEEVHPVLQRPQQAVPAVDLHAGRLAQPLQVGGKLRLLQVHRLIGPEGGQHAGLQGGIGSHFGVPLQAVRRVVGGTQQRHVGLLQNIPDGDPIADDLAAVVPDLFGVGAGQMAVIMEVAAQLQVAPVIKRVARGPLQSVGPGLELLKGIGVAGHQTFLRPVGPHQPPFVVVPLQPKLGEIVKDPVLGDLPGTDVTMVIQDGHLLRHCVVQCPGRFGGQQKIFVQKGLGPAHMVPSHASGTG